MQTICYSIPNISCHHCIMRITQALTAVEGVLSVEGDIPGKQVSVEFEAPATDELIRAKLEEIGYPAELL